MLSRIFGFIIQGTHIYDGASFQKSNYDDGCQLIETLKRELFDNGPATEQVT